MRADEIAVDAVKIHDRRAVEIVGDIVVPGFLIAAGRVKAGDAGAQLSVLAGLIAEPAAAVLALHIVPFPAQDAELAVMPENPDRQAALDIVLNPDAVIEGEDVFQGIGREQPVPVKVQRRVHGGPQFLCRDILQAVGEGAARVAVAGKAQEITPIGNGVEGVVLPHGCRRLIGRGRIQQEFHGLAQQLVCTGLLLLEIIAAPAVRPSQEAGAVDTLQQLHRHHCRVTHAEGALKVADLRVLEQVDMFRAVQPRGVPAGRRPEKIVVRGRNILGKAVVV